MKIKKAALCLAALMLCSIFSACVSDDGPAKNIYEKVVNTVTIDNPQNLYEKERVDFLDGTPPLETDSYLVTAERGLKSVSLSSDRLMLDGEWEMVMSGSESKRIKQEWNESEIYRVSVPDSLTGILIDAGVMPEYEEINRINKQESAKSFTMKDWWFRKSFAMPTGGERYLLTFEGTAYDNVIYLNGERILDHKGMFDGYNIDITDKLKEENTLIVLCKSAQAQLSWQEELYVHSCNARMPFLGIWRSVYIECTPKVKLRDPFIHTNNYADGTLDLYAELEATGKYSGSVVVNITEKFGDKKSYNAQYECAGSGNSSVHIRFTMPEFSLWWPAGMGNQDMYAAEVFFLPDGAASAKSETFDFGIRGIEFTSKNETIYNYNWLLKINGREMFLKGACYNVSDFTHIYDQSRYDYFMELFIGQNANFIRAMGSGMPQPKEFYDACNRYGILVYQEWPTAWDSYKTMPEDLLRNCIVYNTLRLRNEPSLIMYGGGNEIHDVFGSIIEEMIDLNWRLDGTRPFIRTTWYGGGKHEYAVWHNNKSMDTFLNSDPASVVAEFGTPAFLSYESVQKYMPENTDLSVMNQGLWNSIQSRNDSAEGAGSDKEKKFSSLALTYMKKGSSFSDVSTIDLRDYIQSSQLAASVEYRTVIERLRLNFPDTSASMYFRFADEQAITFWGVVDYFGTAKIPYYFIQDSYAPISAILKFPSFTLKGGAAEIPVFVTDDYGRLAEKDFTVNVSAYDSSLNLVKKQSFSKSADMGKVTLAGNFSLTKAQTDSTPLLFYTEIREKATNALLFNTFYWENFDTGYYIDSKNQGNWNRGAGATFKALPKAQLSFVKTQGAVTVTNTSKVPAVGVYFKNERISQRFIAEDNYFWLSPGESRTVKMNDTDIDGVGCING